MNRIAAAALAIALCVPAAAKDVAPPFAGVWKGTVGTAPVTLCFNGTGDGSYYYDRYGDTMGLSRAGEEWRWTHEAFEQPTETLTLAAVAGRLEGRWTKRKQSLPVRLARVTTESSGEDGDRACGSLAFAGPLFRGAAVKSSTFRFAGQTLTRLALDPGGPLTEAVSVESFQLPGDGASIARINAALRSKLVLDPQSSEWAQCIRDGLAYSGNGGDYAYSIKPQTLSALWLSARWGLDVYCGGAHPGRESGWANYDLSTGATVDFHEWLSPRAATSETISGLDEPSWTMSDAFVAWLVRGHKPTEECAGVMANERRWTIGIKPGAMIFTPDLVQVEDPCGEDIVIPYARLTPWLNARGKALLATLPR